MADQHIIPLERLTAAMRRVVAGFGSSQAEIDAVCSNLIDANLTGHDSHGVGMLPRYAAAYLEGGLLPNQHAQVVHDAGAVLRIDGHAGFGQVIGREAMALGIARAQQQGLALVATGNAHHLGRIGAWAEQAAAAGLVSMHFVNVVARPIVAAHGAARAGFGTNPFTAGVPLKGRPPFILDFATSQIAQGKTRVAHNKGELLAEACLLDDQGRPTRDPRYTVVPPFGALMTFGAHKGYGLAALCELLGGALAAGVTGHAEDGSRQRVLNGMLSILVDPAALGDPGGFDGQAAAFIESLLGAPAREGFEKVLVAGDPERRNRAERSVHGVPVDATTWQQILAAAASLGVDPQDVNSDAGIAG
jgi:hydroxycarboxylate dehydrogenase B